MPNTLLQQTGERRTPHGLLAYSAGRPGRSGCGASAAEGHVRQAAGRGLVASRATQLALLGGMALSLGFMIWAGEPTSPTWWSDVLPFAAWVLLPYAIVGAAAFFVRHSPAAVGALFISALLLTASSAIALPYALIFDVRDQSALVFIGLPMWQIPGALLCDIVAIAVWFRCPAA